MLAGISADPLLGPLVACGAGGTAVEVLGDVAVRLAPITDREAAEHGPLAFNVPAAGRIPGGS